MNYLLVEKSQLEDKGLFLYAEQLPDGRCILPMKALKTISGLKNVEIADADEIKRLKSLSPIIPEEEYNPDETSDENNNFSEESNLEPSQELQMENQENDETEVITETKLNTSDDATNIE